MDKLKLPTLLLVSENPSVHFWIKKQLSEQFFILNASDEKAALEHVRTSRLNFVIIDSDVEEYDPLNCCTKIRAFLDLSIPILLITGRLKKSFLDKAFKSGVTDFLNSQLDEKELQLRVSEGRKTQLLRRKTHEASTILFPKKTDASDHS